MVPSQMATFPIANNSAKKLPTEKDNKMNQMGPQSPYQKYFMKYFTIHATEMTTQKCALSMGNYHSQGHSPAM